MSDEPRQASHGGSQVGYGGPADLGRAVMNERRKTTAGKNGEGNYVAMQLANGEVLVERSGGGKGPSFHAEQKLRRQIERHRAEAERDRSLGSAAREQRLAGLEVVAAYAERQPCHMCQHWMVSAKTMWTFPWEPPEKRPDLVVKAIEKVIRERI